MSPKAPTNFVIFERNLKKWPRSFALVIPVGRETLNQQGTRLQDAYGTRIDRFSVTSRTMTTDSIGSKQMDASGRNILSLCVYGVEVEGSKNADSGLHSHRQYSTIMQIYKIHVRAAESAGTVAERVVRAARPPQSGSKAKLDQSNAP